MAPEKCRYVGLVFDFGSRLSRMRRRSFAGRRGQQGLSARKLCFGD
jgi:hypothetical protein